MVPLFLHPGRLTREWIEGRRASHVPPLRLFLFFSILFFLVIQLQSSTSDLLLSEGEGAQAEPGTQVQGDTNLEMYLPGFWPFTKLREALDKQEARLKRLTEKEQEYLLARRALELAPLGLFLLLPLLALFLKLWWMRTGSWYLDHLVMLMHDFAFLCALFVALLLLPLPSWANVLAGVGGPFFYFHRAMRVTYQRGFWRTLGGTLVGSVVTLIACMIVALVLIPYGLLTF